MAKRRWLAVGSIACALFVVPASAQAAPFWQCATFARMFSGVQLFGAAAGWWSQAVGRYDRGNAPREGAVLVLKSIGSMRSGHVATVSKVMSERLIRVTHANWSSRGGIERDVEVMDTSAANDWSQVRVWFRNIQDLGTKRYPAYGFIYGGKAADPNREVASRTTDTASTATS